MSSAHKYTWVRKDGTKRTRYRAKWIGVDGKPRYKRGFERKSDAEAYAADRVAEIRHGVKLDGAIALSGKTTVEAWGKTWLAGLETRDSTRESYKYAVQRINADLGGRTLTSLRPSELRTWRRNLTGRMAEATAQQTAAILAMLLRAAVQDGLLERSPMPPQKKGASATRIVELDELLTLEQVRAWGRGFTPKPHKRTQRVEPAVMVEMPLVAAQTGMRRGELLGLRPEDVNWLKREIRIDHQLLADRTYGPPKTAAGYRTLPMTEEVGDALNRHYSIQPPVEGEPIFRTARDNRWTRSAFWRQWEDARVAAELPDWVHWHALRDVYASTLIRSGLDLRTVMTLMGHTSSEETLRTYARIWPDAQDTARKAIQSMWSPPNEGQGGATGPSGAGQDG